MNKALDIEQIDAGCLSDILGYEVASCSSAKVGTGQTGASYRLTLEAPQGPKTLLAKVAAGDLEARARVKGGYAAEVGFYAHLVDRVAVNTPACYYAAISDDRLHFTLLLEDLAPRRPGVQAAGCTTQQAAGALRNLAGLHAPLWNNPELYEQTFLLGTSGQRSAASVAGIAVAAVVEFEERYAAQLGPENLATVRAAVPQLEAWLGAEQQPFTVLHGDYRLDNLMFGESPDDVVALDWQTAAVGSPTRDLAYFIGTCLEESQRRDAEGQLVRLYHDELRARGIDDYPFERCFADYRRDMLQATMITVIGAIYATGERSADSDAMFLAMATRSCAAIRDLGTLELAH
ncbi:phosphotransferase [Haliea sp. E17]|uniref:phosphotransferase n=1 Tax=Haliea sp. E17 TaxID=3401576 RepID=UPI003AAF7E17